MEQAKSGPNMGQYMLFYKVKNQVSRLYEWEKGTPREWLIYAAPTLIQETKRTGGNNNDQYWSIADNIDKSIEEYKVFIEYIFVLVDLTVN